jgi:GntR family transcriptional regulator
MMVKYQKIADDIRKDIMKGKYLPGAQLALEKEMCQQYGVSRITVKRAVDELVTAGLVVKRRGSGTFVKSIEDEAVKELSSAHQFEGFSQSYKGHEVRTEIIKFDITNPSEDVASKLQMTTEDFIYDIVRLRCADGEPIVIEYTKMPIQLIPGIKRDILEKSIYGYIRDTLHLHIQSAHRIVRALMPTPREKKLLGIDMSMPVLEVEQVAFLDDGRPFEYSISHHRADKADFKAVSIR